MTSSSLRRPTALDGLSIDPTHSGLHEQLRKARRRCYVDAVHPLIRNLAIKSSGHLQTRAHQLCAARPALITLHGCLATTPTDPSARHPSYALALP